MDWSFLKFQEISGSSWLYASAILAIATLFLFHRPYSLRNFDLIGLVLLTPGLLAVQAAQRNTPAPASESTSTAEERTEPPDAADNGATTAGSAVTVERFGYIWLFAMAGYFSIRCLIDLSLVRRPRHDANLSAVGLAFLTVALFAYLLAVVIFREPGTTGLNGARVASSLVRGDTKLPSQLGADPASVLFMIPSAALQQGLARSGLNLPAEQTQVVEKSIVRSAVVIGHLLMLTALVTIGWRRFGQLPVGLAMAFLYLLLPATHIYAMQLDQIIPASLVLWAIVAYRRPLVAGALFALASVSFYPLFLIPLWLGTLGMSGARKFFISFVAVTALLWLTVYFVPPLLSFGEIWSTTLSQKVLLAAETEGRSLGFWNPATQIYRLPIFIVFAVVAVGAAFLPRQKSLNDLIALSALLILMVQFWWADRGGTYVLWYLPLLLILTFRPGISNSRTPGTDTLPSAAAG